MASADLSRRVGKVVGYPLVELSDLQRREFHEALLDAASFKDLRLSSARATWQSVRPTRGARAPCGATISTLALQVCAHS
jgi:hypothetical protein